ncbi:MAG: hypothetical protein QXS17_00120 [Candidatus Micrarchaeaceae archaeon]
MVHIGAEKPIGHYLMSGMHVKLFMQKPLAHAEARLANYPGFVLLSRGSRLEYMLVPDAEKPDHFYTVSIEKDSMHFFIFSKLSPVYFFSEAVLRLISILQLMSTVCTAELSSIYPYLVIALAQRQLAFAAAQAKPDKQQKKQDELSAILSARIKHLIDENSALIQKEAESHSVVTRLLALFIVSGFNGMASISDISAKTGMGVQAIKEAIAALPDFGYRAVFRGADRFDLIGV